ASRLVCQSFQDAPDHAARLAPVGPDVDHHGPPARFLQHVGTERLVGDLDDVGVHGSRVANPRARSPAIRWRRSAVTAAAVSRRASGSGSRATEMAGPKRTLALLKNV